ncbi:hypothetical protein SmJEL517_g02881 [Synchytrium microbalum]|uniref:YbgI/family dinuclear metal center protein n=1 Tax=Synchytrium microbalum TaxID=1806994 RepID=A0A507C471_9FUNG|nr:uncharacterized protein SmJEL517_g02881 [Synchytrium microbalum]TPX34462.1 hypothetical protein SmJEL517_g02881 [Synchytrium microbalum]
MSLLSKVVTAFEKVAPLSLAETSWDNVGTILEAPIPRVANSIFLTIDFTSSVVEEALANSATGVIVSYHPPIFRSGILLVSHCDVLAVKFTKSVKKLTLNDPKLALVLKCAALGVSIYSPHTALDNVPNGINDWLARGCGRGSVKVITPSKLPPPGFEDAGSGRIVTLDEPVPLSTLVARVKAFLKLRHLRLANAHHGDDLVSSIAICAGAGHSVLSGVKADVFLSGMILQYFFSP